MTDDEKRLEKGKSVEDIASLRENLVCLISRAERIKGACQTAEYQLNFAITGDLGMRESKSREINEWPSLDEITSLFTEIRETRSQISVIERRFREWGALK